jgi:hypothetical protein
MHDLDNDQDIRRLATERIRDAQRERMAFAARAAARSSEPARPSIRGRLALAITSQLVGAGGAA